MAQKAKGREVAREPHFAFTTGAKAVEAVELIEAAAP